jgi:hypothetical protein
MLAWSLFHSNIKLKYMNRYERFFDSNKKQIAPCLLVITALFAVASHADNEENNSEAVLSELAILSATAAVTCTNSTVAGDVASPVSVTQTNCYHEGEVVMHIPAQVLTDFRNKRAELNAHQCDTVLTSLAGKTLGPGVYCIDQASTSTNGVLTLDLNKESYSAEVTDEWIFQIGSGTGALTGTDFVVNMANGGDACKVNWWVAEAATITRGDFKGNIYAGGAITITGVGPTSPFHGRAMANAAVTLTNSEFTGCEGEPVTPVDEETSGGICPVEAQTNVVYVKYETEDYEGKIDVIAYLDPDTGAWKKYKYYYGYGDDYNDVYSWYSEAPFEVTKQDATSVYTLKPDPDGNEAIFSEFHIDLSQGVPVVNNCDFNKGKSECVRNEIIESSVGTPQELDYWMN